MAKASPLKARKFSVLRDLLPELGASTRALDLGADNGVIALLLRSLGGQWRSGDLDRVTVRAIEDLVGSESCSLVTETELPFASGEFELVVVVDMLEHVHDDVAFVHELLRVLRPGGTLILNVPQKPGLIARGIRALFGHTDEKHGHVRSGYLERDLNALLGNEARIETAVRYGHAWSEIFDGAVACILDLLGKGSRGKKGRVVTEKDFSGKKLSVATLLGPIFQLVIVLDRWVPIGSASMLTVRAVRK